MDLDRAARALAAADPYFIRDRNGAHSVRWPGLRDELHMADVNYTRPDRSAHRSAPWPVYGQHAGMSVWAQPMSPHGEFC